MSEKPSFDFWYAVNNTEVVLMPRGHLETFGSTVLNYRLISELMDTVGQVRVREGRIKAGQPQIITPEAYSQVMLEGFGEEARKYIDWMREHEEHIRILQYGYSLRRESFSENVVTDSLEAVVERVTAEVKAGQDPLTAVIVGVDSPWDVCLIKLFREVIQQSARHNIQDLEKRKLFDNMEGLPRAVREELERDFLAASRDASQIQALGTKLQRYGVFDEYEDRFFSLVKASNK